MRNEKKRAGVTVDHERKSNVARVDRKQERDEKKKSDGVTAHSEKKSDEVTMKQEAMG